MSETIKIMKANADNYKDILKIELPSILNGITITNYKEKSEIWLKSANENIDKLRSAPQCLHEINHFSALVDKYAYSPKHFGSVIFMLTRIRFFSSVLRDQVIELCEDAKEIGLTEEIGSLDISKSDEPMDALKKSLEDFLKKHLGE